MNSFWFVSNFFQYWEKIIDVTLIFKCNIKDKKLKDILFKYKPDCVFNLAAETHVDRSIDNPESFIQSNIVGVYNLLECFKTYSKKYKSKLIHISQMRFMEIF